MAINLKRLTSFGSFTSVSNLILPRIGCRYNFSSIRLEGGDGVGNQGFSIWQNGSGSFHRLACIDLTARIEIGAVVHSKSVLGANVHIGSGTVVGSAVTIDQSTIIGYNIALSNCTIGDSCVIHNGACIGQDGFGFMDECDNMLKKPQIGHNVIIGKSCMLCGQVGIAGSVIIGDYVTLGGRVAVRGHISIASKVRLAANICVTKDIREPGEYGGFPAVPIYEWRRQVANGCRISSKEKA